MIKHIAFIMDGNRRWAKERHIPTLIGHKKGYENIENIVDHALERKIEYVTFWAFSTENWNREKKEVDYLMNLFRDLFAGRMLQKILKKGGKIQVLGDMTAFPKDIQKETQKVLDQSKDNNAITINIALNYGGRAEILHAVQQIVSKGINSTDITEQTIAQYLYTNGQPDPDLIIRTGGEQRLSGYLPWQGIYSELYFTDKYWPEFDEKEFDKALEEFARRERRFGK